MNEQPSLHRSVTLFGGISILSGIIVGSGIFFIGSYVLQRTSFASGWSLLAWLLGGLITLMYGLIYAELGAMMPEAGGYYVYLRQAFGRPLGFLSGFTNFMLASSGSIAALAIAFSLILSNLLGLLFGTPLAAIWMTTISIVAIVGLSVLNYFGIRLGTAVQKVLLVVKLIPILLIVFAGLFLGTNGLELGWDLGDLSFFETLSVLGYAVIATFWAYEGWTNLNSVAGEVERPGRNIPLSLLISIGSITLLYVLYQVSTFRVLSIAELQTIIDGGNIYTGIDAAYVMFGSVGMYLVIGTMLISVFGALNGMILVFPRVYYAMAKDGLFLPGFERVHDTYKTPYIAIIGSGLMGILLLVFGLDELISLVAFSALFFNLLIFIGLFRLRKTMPDAERPYRVWGYPVLPYVAIGVTVLLLVAVYVENIQASLIGTAIVLAGLPVYYLTVYLRGESR
jgi:APA family basic amino acid/polyamine antiporter